MKDIILTALPESTVTTKGKDLIVKSRDREQSKKNLELFLSSKSVSFTSVFKPSKSGSLNVLSVPLLGGDIIFKPIIAKGAGGLSFEKELEQDLNNYFAGVEVRELKHKDVMSELIDKLDLKASKNNEVIPEGRKNQKRTLTFSGSDLKITNNTGEILTDLTVKQGKKILYLSLKLGATYYTFNGSIGNFFLASTSKKSINEYFGFDGIKMGGFGKEYIVKTNKPNYSKVKSNLEDILSQGIGTKVILVHKKVENDVMVKEIGSTNKVNISSIDESSYVYPEANIRKYANIKCQARINGQGYKVNFQFRGTTASDRGPKYLRILLERL